MPTAAAYATLPGLLETVAGEQPDKPALVGEDGEVLSFAEVLAQASLAARALLATGVGYGDRVAIWAPNSVTWIVASCAAQMIGGAMVPINTRFRGGEAGDILRRVRATVLFTVGDFLGVDYVALLRTAQGGAGGERPVAGLPDLACIVLLDHAADPQDVGLVEWGRFLAGPASQGALHAARARVTPDTIADIMFTSGTTGAPKGAMHTHAQALWTAERWNEANALRSDDRMAIVNPFFHSFGYRAGWVSAMFHAMTAYPVSSFDVGALAALVARERITVLMGAPTLFADLLALPERATLDLSSLRVGHTGSANTPVALFERIVAELGFEVFLTSYGLTEASALVTSNQAGDSLQTIATTVGRSVQDVELRLLAPDGGAPAPGDGGELLVRGLNIMKGYFEDPEATAQAVDADGWLHTGDVATISEGGDVRIVDRLKDIVIVGGFNAYPTEIENVLRAHPAIAEIAVVGAPDPRMGEVCVACVVPTSERPALTLDALRAWTRERLANYKVPRHLLIFDVLPRTALGKPQKFLLRQQVLERLASGG